VTKTKTVAREDFGNFKFGPRAPTACRPLNYDKEIKDLKSQNKKLKKKLSSVMKLIKDEDSSGSIEENISNEAVVSSTKNNQESAAKAIVIADECNKNNYQYLLEEKKWVQIKKFPESVGRIRSIHEINNAFYVVGKKGISTLNNEFYKFPSNKDYNWRTSCQVGNNILVIRKNYGDDEKVVSKFFNTVNKQWSDVNIETKRIGFDVVHYLNKIWIVGGEERDDDEENYKDLNTIQIYDPVNKTISLSPIKMIQARRCHKLIVYNNKLFVFGGYAFTCENLNTVEMYSPVTNKFITMAPMKIARDNFACCRVGNLVYIIGGWIEDGCTDSVEIYDLDLDTWTDGRSIPTDLISLSGCVVNNIITK